jgi:hypothetical protein
MLEWKPKLIVVIAALAIFAALMALVHVGALSTDFTNYGW